MNIKKTQKLEMHPPNEQHSWSETLEENPIIHWILDNGKMLLYILVGLILLGILFFRLFLSSSTSSESDFINAEKEYMLFAAPKSEENDSTNQQASLKSLDKMISAHPELNAKYEGSVAEILLIRGENTQAQKYAAPAIQRTVQENDPFYAPFAQTTLEIANGKYENALKQARDLKEQMVKIGQELKETPEKIPFSTLLYSLNLLRLGMLEQQLGLSNEERKTWQEWKDIDRRSREGGLPEYLDGPLFLSFENLLSEGNITFTDYIETRLRP